jgi:hypothetical protein
VRRAARVDSTQRDIIAALKAAGATVEVLKQPLDLLVGYRGTWALVECKSSRYEAQGRVTDTRKRQLEFRERHPNGGPIHTVWTPEQAIDAIQKQ